LRPSNEHSFIVRVPGAGKPPKGPVLLLLLWQLDRPRPLPFGKLYLLIPSVRPLKLPRLVDLYDKRIGLMRLPAEPVPSGSSGLRLSPLIVRHTYLSHMMRACGYPVPPMAFI